MLLLTVHTQRGKINFSIQGWSYCFRWRYQVYAGKGNDGDHETSDGPPKKVSGGKSKRLWLLTGVLMDFPTLCPRRSGWSCVFLLRMVSIPLRCLKWYHCKRDGLVLRAKVGERWRCVFITRTPRGFGWGGRMILFSAVYLLSGPSLFGKVSLMSTTISIIPVIIMSANPR